MQELDLIPAVSGARINGPWFVFIGYAVIAYRMLVHTGEILHEYFSGVKEVGAGLVYYITMDPAPKEIRWWISQSVPHSALDVFSLSG